MRGGGVAAPRAGLLLAHADDGAEVLPAGVAEGAAPRQHEKPRRGGNLADPGGDPDSLRDQPWALVAPAGPDGDALVAELAPLVRARSEEMGQEARVLRAPPGLDGDDARAWIDGAWRRGWTNERSRPGYVLVAGDYATIPPGFDAGFPLGVRVGRLPFAAPDPVAAYVGKLVGLRDERAGLRIFVAEDGTAATAVARSLVVRPVVAACRADAGEGAPEPETVRAPGEGAGRAVLLSVSHGLGAPRQGWASPEEQRALQGALALGRGDRLTAEDVRAAPFVEGGAWVAWACYGAGTPTRSAYAAWLRSLVDQGDDAPDVGPVLAGLPAEGQPAFASALACAALANPRGPAVVLGHLDLAWTYAVQDEAGQPAPGPVEELVRLLVAGNRAGVALGAVRTAQGSAASNLVEILSRAAGDGEDVAAVSAARSRLWLRRNDLAGWVVLGDPAARAGTRTRDLAAPRRGGEPDRRDPAPPPRGLGALPPLGALPQPGALPPLGARKSPAPLPALGRADSVAAQPSPALEQAILDLLRGAADATALAPAAGVTPTELRALADAYRDAGRAALTRAAGRR